MAHFAPHHHHVVHGAAPLVNPRAVRRELCLLCLQGRPLVRQGLNLGVEPLPYGGIGGGEHLQEWLHARGSRGRKGRGPPPGRQSAVGPPARLGAALGPPSAWLAPRAPQMQRGTVATVVPCLGPPGRLGLGLGFGPAPSLCLRVAPRLDPRGAFHLSLRAAARLGLRPPSGAPSRLRPQGRPRRGAAVAVAHGGLRLGCGGLRAKPGVRPAGPAERLRRLCSAGSAKSRPLWSLEL